jgi:hypothetical protein
VASEGTERRLAAVLIADVVGYARLMAEDEDATVRTVTAYREEIEPPTDPPIEQNDRIGPQEGPLNRLSSDGQAT